jgi:hypothetical protein
MKNIELKIQRDGDNKEMVDNTKVLNNEQER